MFLRPIFMCFIAIFAISPARPSAAEDQYTPDYVGSAACTDCHIDETAAWQESHHAKAWTPTTSQTVLGDFDDATFTLNGIQSRFYREGETYMIETDGPDGQPTRYPVHSVIGIEPLQQYLLETEPGKLQTFDVAWDTEKQRWYHLYPDGGLFAGDGMHWKRITTLRHEAMQVLRLKLVSAARPVMDRAKRIWHGRTTWKRPKSLGLA